MRDFSKSLRVWNATGYVQTRDGAILTQIELSNGTWCYYISKNGTKYAVHNINGRLRAFKSPGGQEVSLLPDMRSKIRAK